MMHIWRKLMPLGIAMDTKPLLVNVVLNELDKALELNDQRAEGSFV